jgi:hypothetical protein
MLCDKGVVSATFLITSGILATTTWPNRSLETAAGSAAATMALTTATPSRLLFGDADWARTEAVFDALMPPMQTVETCPYPAATIAVRMSLTPLVPIIDLVSFFLQVF